FTCKKPGTRPGFPHQQKSAAVALLHYRAAGLPAAEGEAQANLELVGRQVVQPEVRIEAVARAVDPARLHLAKVDIAVADVQRDAVGDLVANAGHQRPGERPL